MMNEDTSAQDLELIANDLEGIARFAGHKGQPEVATKINALVAEIRRLIQPAQQGNA